MNYKILPFLLIIGIFSWSSSETNTDNLVQTIVIDAGHGGKDSGCSGPTNAKEKYVTLAVALKLGEKIKTAFPNVKVVYTREKDVFVELHKRAEIANEHKADLFISIHCNAAITGKNKAFGSETYALGLHRADDNLEVMKRENDVILLEENYEENYDYDPYSTENHIINSLIQSKYLEQSINFATKIERELVSSERKSRGVKQAGFAVLRGAAMPAVLVESGFLTHNTEEKFLNSKEGQEVIADAIFRAFKAYKTELDGKQFSIKSPVLEKPSPAILAEERYVVNVKNSRNFEFKVQLAAISNVENSNLAALIEADKVEIIEENGVKKVVSEGFKTYEEAVAAKKSWVEAGFTDAFVAVYKNGIRTTMADYNAK
ncbi:MAG: N-acetylmuramoyl-L-alanine amidase [Saprospiraceae bacterium]|nr:N-acetylmuramoyl-L-alanine amidase [Saprospiraceae bacterium]